MISTAPCNAGDEDDGKGIIGPFSRFALSNAGETSASLPVLLANTIALTSAAVFPAKVTLNSRGYLLMQQLRMMP